MLMDVGLNRILERLDRGLVHHIIEETDTIVHIPPFFVFLGHPLQPLIDFTEVFTRCVHGLHLHDPAVMGCFDRISKAFPPTGCGFDMIVQLLDDWV